MKNFTTYDVYDGASFFHIYSLSEDVDVVSILLDGVARSLLEDNDRTTNPILDKIGKHVNNMETGEFDIESMEYWNDMYDELEVVINKSSNSVNVLDVTNSMVTLPPWTMLVLEKGTVLSNEFHSSINMKPDDNVSVVKEGVVSIRELEMLGNSFKVFGTLDEPLFLAKDVAKWIGHSKASVMVRMLDQDEIKKIRIKSSSISSQEYLFLTEDGVYETLMRSNKPIAKQFRKKFKEILKQIRKTGEYKSVANILPQTYKEALSALLEEVTAKEKLVGQLEIQKPKVEYYHKIMGSIDSHSTTVVAKDLGFRSANNLNTKLAKLKVIHLIGKRWVLSADYVGKGYWESYTHVYPSESIEGKDHTIIQHGWTELGRKFLADLITSGKLVVRNSISGRTNVEVAKMLKFKSVTAMHKELNSRGVIKKYKTNWVLTSKYIGKLGWNTELVDVLKDNKKVVRKIRSWSNEDISFIKSLLEE